MYGAAKVGAGLASACGALVLALVVLAAGTGSSVAAQGAVGVTVLGQLAQDECVASGPVPSLSAEQATNAETIVAAALALGAGDRRCADRVDGGLHRVLIGEPRARVG